MHTLRLLFLLLLISCRIPGSTSPDQWKILQGSNYTAHFPGDWRLDTTGRLGTVFIALAPLDSPVDQFAENVNFLVQDISGKGLDLSSYAKLSVEQLDELFTNSRLLESRKITGRLGEYQRVEYLGDEGERKLHYVQNYWVKEDTAFVLTLTCEASKFTEYKKLGESILDSFKLSH